MLRNIVILLTVALCRGQDESVCSRTNRDSDLQACLTAITDIAQDQDRFFFGSGYEDRCDNPPENDIACYNPHKGTVSSIASILLTTFEASLVTTYLEINVTSMPGEYMECDNHYVDNMTMEFTIDPSADTSYTPWHMRMKPSMSWQADDTKQYAVIVKDSGSEWLSGLWLNIPGNAVSDGNEEVTYMGPLNFRPEVTPFVFLLFEQKTNDIALNDDWRNITENHLFNFDISQFADEYGLTGPIGISWILTGYDAYGLKQLNTRHPGFVENCASFVQDELANHMRPFIPEDTELTKWTRVQFQNHELDFDYCCKNYKYPDGMFYINPIGNPIVDAAIVRTGNDVTLYVTKNSVWPSATGPSDMMYTVLAVDPDVPVPTVGTMALPLLHWLAFNCTVGVEENKLMCEVDLHSWRGPRPPNDLPHTYYFLLYEQLGDNMSLNDTTMYAGDCPDTLMGRCLFNVTYFAEDNYLNLVGLSWLRSEQNAFVNYTRETPEEDVCPDDLPCESASAQTVVSVFMLTLLLATILLL